MAATRRLARIRADILERTRLPDGSMVVALSGGADSSALLAIAALEQREVRAIHIHHGQPHSERAATAAAATARMLGVSLDVVTVDVAAGSGFEHRARAARYGALSACIDSPAWILTGHTLDDLAETVLMRLARGSGLDGLSGIPETRPPYQRPFLRVRRSETRELCVLAGLPFYDDPTNTDERFLRNRIRRRLIPVLVEAFGTDPSEKLAASALELQRERGFLDRLAVEVEVEVAAGEASVALSALDSIDPVLVSRVLRRMWMMLGFEHPLEAQPVARVMSVLAGSSRAAQLGGRAVAEVRDGRLRIRLDDGPDEVEIGPGHARPASFRLGRFRVDALHGDGPAEFPLSLWQLTLPGGPLPDRLIMRWARPEDVIGSTTVDHLLEAAGVAPSDRWPVVEMGGEVVWVPGVRRVGWESRPETGYLSLVASEESVWGT